MISVRESIFESNSSSAHSLTLCHKSFMTKLMSGVIFYNGPFRYFSDMDETFFNELDEKAFVTKEDVWVKLIEWANKTKADPMADKYQIEDADYILKFSNFDDFRKFIEENDKGPLDNYIDKVIGDYTPWETMFGGEHSDSYIEEAREYELAGGDGLIVRLVNVAC